MASVYHTQCSQYNLGAPDENYGRELTLSLDERRVTLFVPLTVDSNKPYSAMEDRYYLTENYGQDYFATLQPVELASGLTVFVDLKQASLDQKDISSSEQTRSQEVAESILSSIREEQSRYRVFQRSIQDCLKHKRTKLDLWQNSFTLVPDEIFQLNTLQEFNLSDNRISQLPAAMTQLISLRALYLVSNRLTSFPVEICELRTLERLSLGTNELSSIPPAIGQLKNLKLFSVGSNRLSSLPVEIGELTELQDLDLLDNKLSALPVGIGQLQKLRSLQLSDNPFRSLPNSIVDLPPELTMHLVGHNLSEQTLQNFRRLLDERRAAGHRTPTFQFDMPPPRGSADPQPVENSFNVLCALSEFKALPFEIDILSKKVPSARLFLHNLLETSDFTTGSADIKASLAEVVLGFFEYAVKNPEFLELLELFINTANTSCVDRVTMAVMDLEIWVNLKRMRKEEPHTDISTVLEGLLAYHLLHQIGAEKVKELPLSDELDVHLAYLIHCKDLLKKQGVELPFTSKKMRFFGITGVSLEEDIPAATKEVMSVLQDPKVKAQKLTDFLFMQHDILANEALGLVRKAFCDETKVIDEKRAEQQGNLDDRKEQVHLTDQEYQEEIKAIENAAKEAYRNLLENS